ncbi:MAG: sigma-70 family RNA polymerase sigma factor [Flavobacteriales bacterium]|nr:sigma-70 family RNA polymerase sigma factor [Flavobacteriales bacterium]
MSEASRNNFSLEPKKLEIERAKTGDQDAMHMLYSYYSIAMLNTSYRILNNKEDAEDVLQEAFVKAFSSLKQFNYQSTFGAWFKRIVVNQSIDQLKKRRKEIFCENEITVEIKASNEGLPEGDVQEKLNVLYKALHQLPDGYRTVFSLYLLEGYDHDEISEILNIEVSTSISQLSRAKKKLKLLMTKASSYG